MGNNRQGAPEISPFLNNSQKHHTCKNLQDNKRHTGVNEMKLPCQLPLQTWRRWGFLCFTQAVFSPLVPSYWEGYISQVGWMEWRGAERSVHSHTAHFIPGVTDLSYDSSHRLWFLHLFLPSFYENICLLAFLEKSFWIKYLWWNSCVVYFLIVLAWNTVYLLTSIHLYVCSRIEPFF